MSFFGKTGNTLLGFGFRLNTEAGGFRKGTFELFYIDELLSVNDTVPSCSQYPRQRANSILLTVSAVNDIHWAMPFIDVPGTSALVTAKLFVRRVLEGII